MPDYTPKDLHTLSLREFASTVQSHGVPLSYSQLSKFINEGDIAEQLGITGGKNGRKIPQDAVNVLINFWPEYERNRGELPQAPRMLHAFLQKGDALVVADRRQTGAIALNDRREIAPVEGKAIVPAAPAEGIVTQNAQPPMYGYSPTELAAMAVLQGAATKLPLYLTLGEAAKVWRVSTKKFKAVGPPPTLQLGGENGRGDRWLLSDLLPKARAKE